MRALPFRVNAQIVVRVMERVSQNSRVSWQAPAGSGKRRRVQAGAGGFRQASQCGGFPVIVRAHFD